MSPYCSVPGCHDPRTYLYGRLEDGTPFTHEVPFPDFYERRSLWRLSVDEPERLCRIHARQVYGVAQADTLPASHVCPLPELPSRRLLDGIEKGWRCAGCGREWWTDGREWRRDVG